MKVRRCAVLWIEPREDADFLLANLLAGGTGIVSRLVWRAHAPHLQDALDIGGEQVALLGTLSPIDWVDRETLDRRHGADAVDALLRMGLLQQDGEHDPAHADDRLRAAGWHAAAAVGHAASRWQGVNAASTEADAVRRRGEPPPHYRPVAADAESVDLPEPAVDAFDRLLDARTTCRNFDPDARVSLATFSQVMARVFGARGMMEHGPDLAVVKRTSPSGGALHPTECWLVVQRVEGVEPGLYRYRMDGHQLERVTPQVLPPQANDVVTQPLGDAVPSAWDAAAVRNFARIAVAGQSWFEDAPVLCILASRFQRNFWKYRNHAKAYRVTILDVGHLSQTLQLCATQAGLAPFITAAINEIDIERAYGLTGYLEGPLAICGFGIRGPAQDTLELDPNNLAWPG